MYRYSVFVTHIYDQLTIAYGTFKTIKELVKYCNTFEQNQVIFDVKDNIFEESIDIDELLKIWRSN